MMLCIGLAYIFSESVKKKKKNAYNILTDHTKKAIGDRNYNAIMNIHDNIQETQNPVLNPNHACKFGNCFEKMEKMGC